VTGRKSEGRQRQGDRPQEDEIREKRRFFAQKRSLNLSKIYRKFFDKKVGIDKISEDINEDINVGESVLMNVAPLYF
jgi:acyl-[acyl carrier protein]--UDP-N-acetylglucosamine O-acyltransferase